VWITSEQLKQSIVCPAAHGQYDMRGVAPSQLAVVGNR
jgi:hypothetical protein